VVFLVAFFLPVPMLAGADNPLWFYLAGLFHLPSSLLFPQFYAAAAQWVPESSMLSLLVPCVLVALAQLLLVAVVLRLLGILQARLSSNTSLERTRER